MSSSSALANGVDDGGRIIDLPGILRLRDQLLEDRRTRVRSQRNRDRRLGEEYGQKRLLLGIVRAAVIEHGQLLLAVFRQLGFQPVVDLGAGKAPLPRDFLSG